MNQYNIIDNLVIDTETGEVLGNAISDAGEISSQTALEAILEKLADVEGRLTAQQLRHQAILENCRKLEVRTASYLAYLKAQYEPHIEAYAKTRLEGQKSKTLTTPFGSVSFRTVRGGLKVVDPSLALDYAQLNGFTNAIKVSESFQISKLDPAQRELIEAKMPDGFEMVPDKETMSIKVMA
jgi:hypothetical protein